MRFARNARVFLAAAMLSCSVGASAAPIADEDILRGAAAALIEAARADKSADTLEQLRIIQQLGQIHRLNDRLVGLAFSILEQSKLQDELDQFSNDVTLSSSFEKLKPAIRERIATHAISFASRTGDLSRVETLLASVESYGEYFSLLSDRKYEAAWPAIERHAGDNLAGIMERRVQVETAKLQQNPSDYSTFVSLFIVLTHAGKFDEATALRRDWHRSHGEPKDISELILWDMNAEATNLVVMGRGREADPIFDRIAALPSAKYASRTNFLMNRAVQLTRQGRWEESLAAAKDASAANKAAPNPISRDVNVALEMLIAASRTCALNKLGRSKEATADLAYLREHFGKLIESGIVVATPGFLCAGREAEAEKLIAKWFVDGEHVLGLGAVLERGRYEGFSPQSALPETAAFIMSREPLRREMEKHLRLIPLRFAPLGYLKAMEAPTPQ